MALTDKLSAIANAIRGKTGKTDGMTLDQMATEIAGIETGGGDSEILVGLLNRTIQHCSIPDGAIQISKNFFYECRELQSVDIPDSVTTIGSSAFAYCSSLQSVDIPDGVTSIEYGTFQYCSSLQSVDIPDGVTSISSWAFGYCAALSEFKMPTNLMAITGPAFYGCTALTEVIFRSTPTLTASSGMYPFAGCTAITDIYVPWAEGEVSGAPWGAKSATIHYNHTGG